MSFATWSFRIAGMIGLLILVPMLFMENRIGIDYPPAITHPEYFYGFVLVTIAWQVGFIIISRDPVRYRLLMLPAMLEKFPFVAAIIWLYNTDRADTMMLGGAALDLLWGILFVVSFIRTNPARLAAVPPANP